MLSAEIRTWANTMRRKASPRRRARSVRASASGPRGPAAAASLQRDQGADHHADQRVKEAPPDLRPDRLALPGVLAQPGDPLVLQLVGVVRDLGGEPGREMLLGGLEDVRHLAEQRRQARRSAAAAEERDDADDGEGQGGDDEHRQDGDRPALPRLPAAADEMQLAAEDVHQLVDREPPQQRRQQVEMEDQEQDQGGEGPGSDLDGRGAARCPSGIFHGSSSLDLKVKIATPARALADSLTRAAFREMI